MEKDPSERFSSQAAQQQVPNPQEQAIPPNPQEQAIPPNPPNPQEQANPPNPQEQAKAAAIQGCVRSTPSGRLGGVHKDRGVPAACKQRAMHPNITAAVKRLWWGSCKEAQGAPAGCRSL